MAADCGENAGCWKSRRSQGINVFLVNQRMLIRVQTPLLGGFAQNSSIGVMFPFQ
jgi:hypothetical protein